MPVDLARVGSWQSSGAFIALPLSDRLVGPNVELDTRLQTALPVSAGSRLQHLQPPEAACWTLAEIGLDFPEVL